MKNRIVATALCALGLCGLLAGCGTQAPTTTTSGAPTAQDQANAKDAGTKGDEAKGEDTPSKTEQPATAQDLPEDSVLAYFNDEGLAKLAEDMAAGKVPKKCEALYDQMGGLPVVTITNEDEIRQMYDYVRNIRVLAKSDMSMTDAYHFVSFELQDGTSVGLRFEGAGNLVRSDTNYYVDGDAALWAKVRELQGASHNEAHTHEIVINDKEDLVVSCPTSAAAGETVFVQTKEVLDVQTVVLANGEKVTTSHGMTFEFTMPDEPVEVRVYTEEYPFGGGS